MIDIQRLRDEYAKRKVNHLTEKYSLFYPGYLYSTQQLQRLIINVLGKITHNCFTDKRILEIGCGSGGVLQEYSSLGVRPVDLFGIDLLFDRLQECHARLPSAGISNADGQDLPFSTDAFDVVLQYTAFSSILDAQIKRRIAGEMLRVLKQDGFIVWYDFWWNPTNAQTKGIRPAEIKELFPGCRIDLHKTTLAPPVARRVVPVSWGLAMLLESLGILNSHYLVIIRKK